MNDLPDDSLALALSFLHGPGLAQMSAASSHMKPIARTDRLWLPVLGQRWRFGALPATAAVLSPGKREVASENAIAQAVQGPVCGRTGGFAFFLKRSQQEVDVATLVLQAHAACSQKQGESELQLGTVVTISGLAKAPQYNGHTAVITSQPTATIFANWKKLSSRTSNQPEPEPTGNEQSRASSSDASPGDASSQEQRISVTLVPSLRSIAVRRSNLTSQSGPLSMEEIEKRVLEIGDEGIDALVRATAASEEFAPAAGFLHALLMEQWAVRQWTLLKEDKQRLDLLEEGGLVVAQWAEADAVDVAEVRATLAALADSAMRRTPSGASLRERIEVVNYVLYVEHGFKGNTEAYYDPRNSLLHRVLASKTGIPISLSIIWAAVARRLDVPCHLCASMPAHVLIRVNTGAGITEDLFVDAFNQSIMDYAGVIEFARGIIPHNFQEEWVAAGPPTSIYARVLRNLMGIYQQQARSAARPQMKASLQRFVGACSQCVVVSDGGDQAEYLKHQRDEVKGILRRIRQADEGS